MSPPSSASSITDPPRDDQDQLGRTVPNITSHRDQVPQSERLSGQTLPTLADERTRDDVLDGTSSLSCSPHRSCGPTRRSSPARRASRSGRSIFTDADGVSGWTPTAAPTGRTATRSRALYDEPRRVPVAEREQRRDHRGVPGVQQRVQRGPGEQFTGGRAFGRGRAEPRHPRPSSPAVARRGERENNLVHATRPHRRGHDPPPPWAKRRCH
jgi:hypothetical protein